MSLFSSPKMPEVPKEDPAIAAARVREQQKADTSLTMSIQENLRRKMQSRLRSFGLVQSPAAAAVAGNSRPSVTSGFMTAI